MGLCSWGPWGLLTQEVARELPVRGTGLPFWDPQGADGGEQAERVLSRDTETAPHRAWQGLPLGPAALQSELVGGSGVPGVTLSPGIP